MKVVLLKDIKKIGKKFEIKNVADGFALNMLIPQKKARIATPSVIKEVEKAKEKQMKIQEVEDAKLLEDINDLINTDIDVPAKINKDGHLFAGVGKEEIILAIKDQKAIDIKPEHLILEKPIKESGKHSIEIEANGKSVKLNLNIIQAEE